MKRFIKILILIFCIIISLTSDVKADDNTAAISAQIDPSYTLIMPASILIPFDNNKDVECYINFDSLLLEDGYGLDVTIDHDNFTHSINPSYQFFYDTDFSETIITNQNKKICFKVHLDEDSHSVSPPGKYTTKITLTIKYVKL